jgi:hypothetical protein
MTANVLDHTQDLSGSEQHRLTNIYAPPAFVKAANHEQLYGDAEKLPHHVYADPTKRLYPLHTAAATWMSALFLFDKKANFEPHRLAAYEAKLNETARHFGIAGDIAQLKVAMARDENNDVARLPDTQFALVWEAEGKKERHYPLRNRIEVKTASEWFGKHRDMFAFDDRRQIASKILARADELAAPVADIGLLVKAAGHGTCGTEQAIEMFEKRAGLVNSRYPDLAVEMQKLANSLRASPLAVADNATRLKMAATVDQFDRHTHLNRLYDDGGLERPEEILFRVTQKAASEFLQDHISTTTGSIYEKAALAKLTLGHIQQWMGREVAEAVSAGGLYVDMEKLADVVTTLPRGDAQMFDKMAESVGIQPYAVEKAAEAIGPDRDEIKGLASLYQQMASEAVPLS